MYLFASLLTLKILAHLVLLTVNPIPFKKIFPLPEMTDWSISFLYSRSIVAISPREIYQPRGSAIGVFKKSRLFVFLSCIR